MSTDRDDHHDTCSTRPKRADARRNYDKVLAAAREAFAEGGESTALEEIARRAGVGIGTLYRHFPNRQALLEALYVEEVEEICRSAAELRRAPTRGRRSTSWFERFIGYIATKQALAAELLNYLDRDAQLFKSSRAVALGGGRAAAHARPGGRRRAPGRRRSATSSRWSWGSPRSRPAIPSQTTHILRIALDGLRYRPA